MLGEFVDSTGAGVLGKNTAGSGTPIGVEGAVPNAPGGYGLSTPDDAKIDGWLETVGNLNVVIDGNANIFHGGDGSNGYAGNVVMGPWEDTARRRPLRTPGPSREGRCPRCGRGEESTYLFV